MEMEKKSKTAKHDDINNVMKMLIVTEIIVGIITQITITRMKNNMVITM